jgi:hypothetical protein
VSQPASNTEDCFRAFVGKNFRGYFHDGDDSYLIFEDGRAIVFHQSTGAYWVEQKEDVDRKLHGFAERQKRILGDLYNVLELAGETPRMVQVPWPG